MENEMKELYPRISQQYIDFYENLVINEDYTARSAAVLTHDKMLIDEGEAAWLEFCGTGFCGVN